MRNATRETDSAVPDGRRGEKPKFTPAGVPSIVDDFFTKADQLGIPVLGQIVTAPVFGSGGALITTPRLRAVRPCLVRAGRRHADAAGQPVPVTGGDPGGLLRLSGAGTFLRQLRHEGFQRGAGPEGMQRVEG